MTRPFAMFRKIARAGTLIALLVSPIVLVPTVKASNQVTIEQPSEGKKGLGLVLLVALQRA
jgi:hypothetical protein